MRTIDRRRPRQKSQCLVPMVTARDVASDVALFRGRGRLSGEEYSQALAHDMSGIVAPLASIGSLYTAGKIQPQCGSNPHHVSRSTTSNRVGGPCPGRHSTPRAVEVDPNVWTTLAGCAAALPWTRVAPVRSSATGGPGHTVS